VNVAREVAVEASVSGASFRELRKMPYKSSRTVTRSPGVNPMNVESAGSWRMESGTVTSVFIPIRSTATMAVKILVRLAGARAARPFDFHRKRPGSRVTGAASCASIAGAGVGRSVGRGPATAAGRGNFGDGPGVGG